MRRRGDLTAGKIDRGWPYQVAVKSIAGQNLGHVNPCGRCHRYAGSGITSVMDNSISRSFASPIKLRPTYFAKLSGASISIRAIA